MLLKSHNKLGPTLSLTYIASSFYGMSFIRLENKTKTKTKENMGYKQWHSKGGLPKVQDCTQKRRIKSKLA